MKAFRVVWDKQALQQLLEILRFLRLKSQKAPLIVQTAIIQKIENIQKEPFICEVDRLKIPKDENFRAFVVFSYRVSYQVNTQQSEIRILRIRHTSREPVGY